MVELPEAAAGQPEGAGVEARAEQEDPPARIEADRFAQFVVDQPVASDIGGRGAAHPHERRHPRTDEPVDEPRRVESPQTGDALTASTARSAQQ